MSDYTKAEEYLKKSLECSEIGQDKNNESICHMNLANIYIEVEEYHKAMECLEKAIQLTKEVYYGHQPLHLGLLYNNIGLCNRRLNRVEDAEKYYQLSLDVKRNTVGDHHPLLCQTYTCLSTIESLKGDEEKALQYNQLAADIYKRNDTPQNDTFYMRCKENVILNLLNLGRKANAVSLYIPFFELLEKEMKNGNSHLIDGTLPLVHLDILKYLIQNKQEEVARKVLKTLVKTKAVTPLDYVLLREVNTKLNPGDKAPDSDDYNGSMSVDEALKEWPSDRNLLEYKIQNLINSEDSQALIDYFNSVCPGIYNINSFVNFILGMFATTENFSNKMFVDFNENALSRLPETEVECIKNCLRNTAESYEREKLLDKSLELYKQWIELDRDHPYPYFKVSYCLALATGDIEEAKKYCTEARERAEKSGPSQAQLLQKILQLEGFLEEAEKSKKSD